MNARIADLIREGKRRRDHRRDRRRRLLPDADVQQALIEHVLAGASTASRRERLDEPPRLPRRARAGGQASRSDADRCAEPAPTTTHPRSRSPPQVLEPESPCHGARNCSRLGRKRAPGCISHGLPPCVAATCSRPPCRRRAAGPAPRGHLRDRLRRRRCTSPDLDVPNPLARSAALLASTPPAVRRAAHEQRALALWQRPAQAYGIPWQVLAAINKIESNFGQNMGPSSAGAVGWMQFMPSTWLRWGIDASGDGIADP